MPQETVMLDGFYTIRDVMKMFDVSKMTVHNWRNRKVDPLPTIVIPGSRDQADHAIRFNPKEVKSWAKRRNKKIRQLI